MKGRRSRAGFTLVELMVVAIIVAILAAVAIPLMSANKKRAMVTEAEAALGTVRTALRAQYAQTSRYDMDLSGNDLDENDHPTNIVGIGATDLDGKYFTTPDYSFSVLDSNEYTVVATGTNELDGITVTLDEAGDFVYTGL